MSMETSLRPTSSVEGLKAKMGVLSVPHSAFDKLPDEIIEQILHICDPNSFASLILLNRKWRGVSQQAHLYIHHLSQCRSFAAAQRTLPPITDENQLPLLRSTFAREVKRNLFEAFLRPRETIINLVSNSISSSAAFPGGEAFHFAFSPKGHHVLAYSTSRIYVINISEPRLVVERELKILRRPASVTILDDGSLLAVLSTDHQVDLYNLTGERPRHIQAVALDHAPRTITLSPAGSALAAAYDGGVEVYSLASTALATDRRSVKCDAADSLSFSQDGTQLLGTTLHSRNPSTVILTAPYYDPGDLMPKESISQLWTTSILFPNSSRDCSHAVLLPSPWDDEASWAFTYDRVFETFRAVRIDDLRNGTTYFTGPMPDKGSVGKLLPCTLPAATGSGELVAAGFQGKEIWLYGVPGDLDASPDANQNGSNNTESEAATPTGLPRRNSAPWPRDSTNNRIPQWQLLCDKSRNTFVEGRKVCTLEGISAVKWVTHKQNTSCSERLIVAAPGVVGQPSEGEEDGMAPADGGRFSILEFDYRPTNGEKSFLTIEVGDKEPEVLEEEHRDMEEEVAIVRRRTVAQKWGIRANVLRSATVATRSSPQAGVALPRAARVPDLPPIPPLPSIERGRPRPAEDQPETASIDEEQEALDAPYSHGSPRSAPTLRRAATAAAINRRLNPPRVAEHIEYRRADGREEHPHESDADNWVPPPPPYSREPVAPLPEHLRNAVLAGSIVVPSPNNLYRSSTQRSSSSIESNRRPFLQRSQSTFVPSTESSGQSRIVNQQAESNATVTITSDDSFRESQRRRQQSYPADFDELYDVSPPGTPEPVSERPVSAVSISLDAPPVPAIPVIHTIPRRPVASPIAENPSPHSTAVNVLLLRPVSPMLQQTAPENNEQAERRTSAESEGMGFQPNPVTSPRSPPLVEPLTRTEPGAPVHVRPKDDHHLTEPLPSTPRKPLPGGEIDVSNSNQALSQIKASPSALSTGYSSKGSPNTIVFPSASQLARLNSRSGRPASRVLGDPSRHRSSTFTQPQFASPIPQDNIPPRVPVLNAPPHLTRQYPPAIAAEVNSPLEPSTYSPTPYSPSHNLSWRGNLGPTRHMPSSTPTLRPRIQRLDTIHSITSQGDQATHFRSTAAGFEILRKPSRAERSAALNIQQAKKRGWGGTKKSKKNRDKDGASSAGWTDVTTDSYGDNGDEIFFAKKKKCAIM